MKLTGHMDNVMSGHKLKRKKKAKRLTKGKAAAILEDGSVSGYPLSEKQRRYMGAVASGSNRK